MADAVRWAVLGTANIAAKAFLPAMRAAGDRAVVVGSRDPQRAAAWAHANQVGRADTLENAVSAEDVDAVYVAVPNPEHVVWAARAAAAGKAVLCEKPLGLDTAEVDGLLAEVGDAWLWEAFVFPFHPQTTLLRELCAPGGEVGPLREITSEFHFDAGSGENIRWEPAGGGALLDVGCYPLRLARLLFDAEPVAAGGREFLSRGVDAEIAAVVDFPADQRLIFSAGMRRSASTATRLIGRHAELRVSNPFHPGTDDTVELRRAGRPVRTWPAAPGRAFEHAARHVADVVRGRAQPRHLARDDAAGNARALDLVRTAVRSEVRA